MNKISQSFLQSLGRGVTEGDKKFEIYKLIKQLPENNVTVNKFIRYEDIFNKEIEWYKFDHSGSVIYVEDNRVVKILEKMRNK